MIRADLITRLAALVARRAITPAQAQALLEAYDQGEITDADLPTLTMPPSDRNDWLTALLLVLLLTRTGSVTRPLTAAKRRQARNSLRANFEGAMGTLAVAITTGALAVQAWQNAMQAQIAAYTRQMAVAGAGTLPGAATIAAVEAALMQQWGYLQNFALVLAAKGAGSGGAAGTGAGQAAGTGATTGAGGGMSVAAVAARSRMYGNVGHAAFWQGQGDDPQAGYIERWVSQDDGKVCPNCSRLEGQTFLPGDGPMPGSVCFGTCRCQRVLEYNPDEYAKLGGALAPRKAA